jgi:predicted ATPase/DNA-binding winged helix-turn-helix (wHTH) protein
MSTLSEHPEALSFGQTVVMLQRRELTRAGRRVEIGARAFDVLLMLMQSRGAPVTRDAIRANVWTGRVVEENTLESQISALRRALGDDRHAIRTISGRGYQFVADLEPASPSKSSLDQSPAAGAITRGLDTYPASYPLLGREKEVADVFEIAKLRRLVTLVGTGGVGKTRLAFEVACALAPHFPDGVFCAQLAASSVTDYVSTTLVTSLGDTLGESSQTLDKLVQSHSGKHFLLVLDNCEHLIDSIAGFTERLLSTCPRATVIATSREALRLSGEYLYRVPSLDIPTVVDAQDARSFGAVQLFEHLVQDCVPEEVRNEEMPIIVQICRRLDGIPLAIELAAACVSALGLPGVADQLDDRFRLLTRGSRTALPRQQTLLSTLNWSYELLDETQRCVLERLSLFAGHFSLAAAQLIASDEAISMNDVVAAIIDLEHKSLVCSVAGLGKMQYRLLETTRAYARRKADARGDYSRWALRHAHYVLEVFQAAEKVATGSAQQDWLETYVPFLEDLRAAVFWGFSPEGDWRLAVDLTVASIPLSLQVVVTGECLARVDAALRCLAEEGSLQDERAMKLYAARGVCLLAQSAGSQTGEAFERARTLAEKLDNVEYQLRAIWGCWNMAYRNGRYAETFFLSERFSSVAMRSQVPYDRIVALRMSAVSHLFKAELGAADVKLRAMLQSAVAFSRPQRVRFLYDERMMGHAAKAHVQWLRGRPDGGTSAALHSLSDAEELDHPTSLCYALCEAVCTLAMLTGNESELKKAIRSLNEASRRHSMPSWKIRTNMWEAYVEMRDGSVEAFKRVIVPGLVAIGKKRFLDSLIPFLVETALLSGRQGQTLDALAVVDPALERALEVNDECSLPELLRAKAELVLIRDGISNGCDEAEQLLRDACSRSERHGLLSWQLRAGTSLARLWLGIGRSHEAHTMLRSIYANFTEGFDTKDLREARVILDALTVDLPLLS